MTSSTTWRYPIDNAAESSTSSTLYSCDFVQQFCSINFHRRIYCQATSSAVTFAVCGQLNSETTILYCLPSGCLRYIGIFLDGICKMAGVRLIAIDRPGSGGTMPCPLKSRLKMSLRQTISVLQSLDLLDKDEKPCSDSPIVVMAHSVGSLYALQLLAYFNPPTTTKVSPFGPRPRLILSSPWVPTSISRSNLLLLPPRLVRLNTTITPGLTKAVGAMGTSMGMVSSTGKHWLHWSAGIAKVSSTPNIHARIEGQDQQEDTTSKEETNPFFNVYGTEPPISPVTLHGQKVRSEARRKWSHCHFLPPHESHLRYSFDDRSFPPDSSCAHPATGKPFHLNVQTGSQLLIDYMLSEGYTGVTEDFLLSLGHAPELPNTALEQLIKDGIRSLAGSRKGADVTIVWASGDKLVPARGRTWLDGLWREAVVSSFERRGLAGSVRFERLEMADAGHDATMASEAVVIDLLRRAKESTSKTAEDGGTMMARASSADHHARSGSVNLDSLLRIALESEATRDAASGLARRRRSSAPDFSILTTMATPSPTKMPPCWKEGQKLPKPMRITSPSRILRERLALASSSSSSALAGAGASPPVTPRQSSLRRQQQQQGWEQESPSLRQTDHRGRKRAL